MAPPTPTQAAKRRSRTSRSRKADRQGQPWSHQAPPRRTQEKVASWFIGLSMTNPDRRRPATSGDTNRKGLLHFFEILAQDVAFLVDLCSTTVAAGLRLRLQAVYAAGVRGVIHDQRRSAAH
jgi:hypothetical protein